MPSSKQIPASHLLHLDDLKVLREGLNFLKTDVPTRVTAVVTPITADVADMLDQMTTVCEAFIACGQDPFPIDPTAGGAHSFSNTRNVSLNELLEIRKHLLNIAA